MPHEVLEQIALQLSQIDMSNIDPIEFGRLQADVDTLKGQVTTIGNKVDALLEMANQGKGGLWMFNSGLVFAGALLAWVIDHFKVLGK